MTNEIKKIVKQEVAVSEMDRDQLLDYLKDQLQKKHVDTIDELFAMFKDDLTSVVLDDKGMQAYLAILRDELASKAADLKSLNSSSAVGQYLADKYSGLKQEELHVICINNANKVVSDTMVSKGTIDKSKKAKEKADMQRSIQLLRVPSASTAGLQKAFRAHGRYSRDVSLAISGKDIPIVV